MRSYWQSSTSSIIFCGPDLSWCFLYAAKLHRLLYAFSGAAFTACIKCAAIAFITGHGGSLGLRDCDVPSRMPRCWEYVQVLCLLHNDAGDYRTQFHIKAEKIAEALTAGQYDFGFLHIKAVDDTGHDQQPVLKVCCHTSCPESVSTTAHKCTWADTGLHVAAHATCGLWFLLSLLLLTVNASALPCLSISKGQYGFEGEGGSRVLKYHAAASGIKCAYVHTN